MSERPESSSVPGSSEPRLWTTAGTVSPSSSSPSSSSSPHQRKRKATLLSGSPPPPPPAPAPQAEILLPEAWRKTLPPEQHEWVSRALFVKDPAGKRVFTQDLQLWYHPPGPKLVYHQCPSNHHDFYQRPFFLWAPYRMWRYHLKCQGCGDKLRSCGVYKTVRKVLDTNGWYYMATEYLACRCCTKKVAAWSEDVRKQLDLHHQLLFPAVMAYRLSCDKKLLALMRGGGSVRRLRSFLTEQHMTEWMGRGILFLHTCKTFKDPAHVPALPKLEPVPSSNWLMATYVRDSFSRISELRAKVTSTFGSILKMIFSSKVAKKLGGADAGTAQCMTTVGNELGQVLVSVLTKAEDSAGLQDMSRGLQDRYQRAGKDPPLVLYVDRDCCGLDRRPSAAALFPTWPQMSVRLDIRCFLLRLAEGVTSKSHALYPDFLQRLSGCIFEWNQEDLSHFRMTKQSEQSSSRRISVIKELSRHCRRCTRGAQETERLIDELLQTFMEATDAIGVPLLDWDRMKEIWTSERKHVACIQDPPGVQLYTRTSEVTRNGVSLPVYRCARGSSSLHMFHSYLSRFIPGTSVCGCYFQMYLLEGLTKWNEDRAQGAAGRTGTSCCSSLQKAAFNQLSQHFYGVPLAEGVTPLEYTGELIGISYLYSQTGRTLQDFPGEPDVAVTVEDDEIEEEEEEVIEEEFDDVLLDTLQPLPLEPSSQSTPPSLSEAACSSEVSVSSDAAGFHHVVKLTKRLVEFCRKGHISSPEVEEIVGLWKDLPEADKGPVNYPPLYRMEESFTKRHLIRRGQAAVCPDTNRLVEVIFVQLCTLHPSSMMEGDRFISRWTLVLRDYSTIRSVVTSHPALRTRTGLQLFPVNQTTLIQWHRRFISTKERAAPPADTTPTNTREGEGGGDSACSQHRPL